MKHRKYKGVFNTWSNFTCVSVSNSNLTVSASRQTRMMEPSDIGEEFDTC